ncbi:MAG: InlB B-repeat-containing protein, partial [Christensenellales bacterium]
MNEEAIPLEELDVIVLANSEAPAEPELPVEEPAEAEAPAEPELPAEEPAEVEAPAEPELPAEEPAEIEAPAEPELPAEEPVEVEAPAEPELPAEEPAEIEAPAEPELPAEEPAEIEAPAEPELPVEEPAEAEAPAEPELPAEEPAEVEAPAEPELPAEEPAEIEAPAEPELPAEEPEAPAEPELPAEEPAEIEAPAEPELPAEEPAEVEAPAKPELPAEEPEAPAEPELPVEEPAEAEAPAEPELPAEEPVEVEAPAETELPAEEPAEVEAPAEPELPAEVEAPAEPELPAEEPEVPLDEEVSIYETLGTHEEIINAPERSAEGLAQLINTNITNTSGSYQIMRFIQPDDTPTNTYIFKKKDGTEIRRQVVAQGDPLFEPAALPPGEGFMFLGWYAGDEKLDFGSNGQLIIEEITEDGKEITVMPKFAKVYYVTFYDADNSTVLSRRPVLMGEEEPSAELDISGFKADPFEPNQEFSHWKDANGQQVYSPVEVSKDMDLYPVFSEGYWITFDANRTDAMEGVNVDYTAPKFVKQNEPAEKPNPPKANSPAFEFDGWYRDMDCTEAFAWGENIDKDIKLYAKWEEYQVPFKIIVWTQNVNDDKGAGSAEKTYDVFKVYDSKYYPVLTADIGGTVSLSGRYPNFSYGSIDIDNPSGAFKYNSDKSNLSVEVLNNGSSTLNIYYDRELLTIRFYKTFNSYDDYTGLYGQTLAQNGYTWPEGRWQDSSGRSTLTFLDAFIFDTLEAYKDQNDSNLIHLYYATPSGSSTVNHYKQNVDGETYPADPTNSTNSSGNISFNISNKYTGFEAAEYRYRWIEWYGYQWWEYKWSDWADCSAGDPVPGPDIVYNILEVRYKRNKYNVYFYDGSMLYGTQDKFFEAPLDDLSSYEILSPNPSEKTFGGWALVDGITDPNKAFDFTQKKMPSNNISLYAIWVPVAYNVQLDADGGTMSSEQATSFWLNHGEKIDGTWMSQAKKDGYDLVGWYSGGGDGIVWNFENGITADLCDEGPEYDEKYSNYYYTLKLKDKWRLNGTVSISYDTNDGTGTFEDNNKYVQGGTARILSGEPTPPQGLFFLGWLAMDGKIYHPDEAIVLTEELINTDDGGNHSVTLTAVYTTEVPKATITYHANYEENDSTKVMPDGEPYYYWNQSVKLEGSDTFERKGYKLIGWNSDKTDAQNGNALFACSVSVLVSALGTNYEENEDLVGNNDLYAVWEPVIAVSSASKSWTYNGQSHTYQKYTVTYGDETYVGDEGQTEFSLPDGSTLTITPTGKGENGVKNVADTADTNEKNNTYNVEPISDKEINKEFGTLKINRRDVTLTAGSAEKPYDGTPLTNDTVIVSGDGFVKGEGATYEVTGSQLNAGSSDNEFTYKWNEGTDSGNYNIYTQKGTLKVTKRKVTLIAGSAEKPYDGTPLTNDTVIVSGDGFAE